MGNLEVTAFDLDSARMVISNIVVAKRMNATAKMSLLYLHYAYIYFAVSFFLFTSTSKFSKEIDFPT